MKRLTPESVSGFLGETAAVTEAGASFCAASIFAETTRATRSKLSSEYPDSIFPRAKNERLRKRKFR